MNQNSRLALTFHALFILFLMAPLIVVVAVAFTAEAYLSLPTSGVSLRWFAAIFDNRQFVDAFLFSVTLAFGAATLALGVMLPVSLAIAKSDLPGAKALEAFFLSPLMIPSIVIGIASLRFLTAIGMTGTYTGLVICHAIIVSPFVLRLSLAAATGLDRNYERAALSLGATRKQVFWKVVLPLIKPGLISGWVLAFITSFDDVTVTIFVASPSTMTLPVRLFTG
jgi:putative spermidine/putrescine transport system permease protein